MTLKVISLNMWHGALLDKAIDFLRGEDADLVLLQEVYDGEPKPEPRFGTLSALRRELPYEHVDFAKAYIEHMEDTNVPHGNAVLSKLPILESELHFMVPPPSPDFQFWDKPEHWPLLPAPLQQARLESPVGDINVFNLHGTWDLAGGSFSPRRQQMRNVIMQRIAGLPRIILAGDSNATPDNELFAPLNANLSNVFAGGLTTTFNMRHKDNPGYATAAVDIMYVSPDIKIVDKCCPNVDVSDHLPLIATLEID